MAGAAWARASLRLSSLLKVKLSVQLPYSQRWQLTNLQELLQPWAVRSAWALATLLQPQWTAHRLNLNLRHHPAQLLLSQRRHSQHKAKVVGRQRFNLRRGRLAAQLLPTQRKLLVRL